MIFAGGRRTATAALLSLVMTAAVLTTFAPAVSADSVTRLPEGFSDIVVDPVNSLAYISSWSSHTVAAVDFDGRVRKVVTGVPGAGAMTLEDGRLYVLLSRIGAVEVFEAGSLARLDRLAEQQLNGPDDVVFAGDSLWITDDGGDGGSLASVDPATGAVSRFNMAASAGGIVGNPADPNMLIGWYSASPTSLGRRDVTGAPLGDRYMHQTSVSFTRDIAVSPDGLYLYAQSGAPAGVVEFTVFGLEETGRVFPNEPYGAAVDISSSRGGLLASATSGGDNSEVRVYRLSAPQEPLFVEPLPLINLYKKGLVLTPDGTRALVVGKRRDPGQSYPTDLVVLDLQPSQSSSTGFNAFGQLGNGETDDRAVAGAVPVADVEEVAAGLAHSLTLTGDGAVYASGWNGYGQLGDGTQVDRADPTVVGGLSNVVGVSAGFMHSLAVKSDGTVWAWGWNGFGQLGDGSLTGRRTPVRVGGLEGIVAVSAGAYHSLALGVDGSVWAWGWNAYGQLGDGTTADRIKPKQVAGLVEIESIAAGGAHSLALRRTDRSGYGWGMNAFGQLGDGSDRDRLIPVRITSLGNLVQVAAGFAHSLALDGAGSVKAFGWNGLGQLGDGTSVQRRLTPHAIAVAEPVSHVSAGIYHSLAAGDGRAWAWGYNEYGQLGDATRQSRRGPVRMSATQGTSMVAAGGLHSIVKMKDD